MIDLLPSRNIDIIIPTIKPESEIFHLQVIIMEDNFDVHVIPVCNNFSAAKNRNIGLSLATREYVIMCDDDIEGFFPGWAGMLVSNFTRDPDVLMASARLIKGSGAYATMMGSDYVKNLDFEEVKSKQIPSACIAIRRPKVLRFDEGFKGSGFEDTWFCDCLALTNPNGKFIIDNRVKLVHRNEQKNQVVNHEWNSSYYERLKNNAE